MASYSVTSAINTLLENNVLRWVALVLLTCPYWTSGIAKLTAFSDAMAETAGLGLPAPMLITALIILVQLLGSLSLIIGRFVWLGAGALGVFSFLATLIAHNFWNAPPEDTIRQFITFTEHMGLIGGLMVAAILARMREIL